MLIRTPIVVTAVCLTLIAAAIAARGERMNEPTPDLRVTEAEWVAFKIDRGKVLNAIRLVAASGHEGAWVGDAMRGMDEAKAAAELERVSGLDAGDPEAAWDKLVALDLPLHLRNAIDVAVWDLHGRAKDRPGGHLLGTRKRDRVKLNIAGFPNTTAEQNAEIVRQCAHRDIKGYKVYTYLKGFGPARDPADADAALEWLASDIEIAKAARGAATKGMVLMFYNGQSYDLKQAVQVGAALDALNYAVFFDPMPLHREGAADDYKMLRDEVEAAVCAPIQGGLERNRRWIDAGAVDMAEIDLYAGFTECLRLVRHCEAKGVPLDLHGGFPMDVYQFPLYAFVSDEVLPWIGWHSRSPKWLPVSDGETGSEVNPEKQPWLKRVQTRPVDAEGYVLLVYDMPGMGVEPNWGWVREHQIKE